MPTAIASPHPPRRHAVHRALLRHSRTLHAYLSMLAAVLFLFFGTTGFMLDHPAWFGLDDTRTAESTVTVPPGPIAAKDKLAVVEFLRAHGATGAVQPFDWPGEGEPFHVAFKSPRGQCDADISLPDGQAQLGVRTRGLAGLVTRLHTAKDAGRAWRLLVDATAIPPRADVRHRPDPLAEPAQAADGRPGGPSGPSAVKPVQLLV